MVSSEGNKTVWHFKITLIFMYIMYSIISIYRFMEKLVSSTLQKGKLCLKDCLIDLSERLKILKGSFNTKKQIKVK